MAFDSIIFFLFLITVLTLYWMLIGRTRRQNLLLLLSSYVFYGWWDWRFLGLIIFTTVSSYGCALAIEHSLRHGQSHRASWANALNIVVNLGILALFKYYDFFCTSMQSLLAGLGLETDWPLLHLILPVGISFYTFQSLSYTIDVRRGTLAASHRLLDYATYLAFFPQLVAGPIERATHLLPQFEHNRTFNHQEAIEGCRLMLWGFFKKIVIADNCATTAELIFHDYDHLGSLSLLYGAMVFAFQIYADFSGYSDIAIGTARLFGIRLSRNFDCPYLATSIPDFWRRWHISLTSWFRDYVYIPLGGSRCGRWRTFANTLIIFGLSGLWHGANWTFVCWGLYHGLLFFPYNMQWLKARPNQTQGTSIVSHATEMNHVLHTIVTAGQRLLTFLLVCVGWVLFRAESIQTAGRYLWHMFTRLDFSIPPYSKSILPYVLFMLWVEWHPNCLPRRAWVRWLIYYALLLAMLWKGTAGSQFIYFQF